GVAPRRVGTRIELLALLPVDLNRRHGGEKRTREMTRAADPGLADRLVGSKFADGEGEAARIGRQVVDRAGDRRAEMRHRKTGNAMDARLAAGQGRPVLFEADAQRGDGADAGDRDDRAVLVIA